ncbi:MAG: succinylglutamate desuccinylase/aspartoacylase family protein [Candidatus Thorarchaeota archaeon]|jgi:predicted deacylase
MKTITVGSATSEPGKLVYGYIDGIDHPTGTPDRIPVIIAQGKTDGPTFFLTANVHGNELTGVAVLHDVMTEELAGKLKGTVVAIPTLNPTGLRHSTRSPDYDPKDPNRLYPEGRFEKKDLEDEDTLYPRRYELLAKKVFSVVEKEADFMIDFHNHTLRSIPFSILDRIFYDGEEEKESATDLARQQKEMIEAFGVTYAADYPAKKYMNLKYHRSVSGSVLNSLRKPAFTVELGANAYLVPEVVAGSVKGTLNVLKWAGMLEGPIEKITEFEVPQPGERVRRLEHPLAPQSGIVRLLVNPGEFVTKGQNIAKIADIHGRPIGDGFVRTEHDGIMIALRSEMTVYQNDPIAEMGVKDEEDILAPMPK